MELLTSAGWTSRLFRAIESWPENTKLWDEWEKLYCTGNRIEDAGGREGIEIHSSSPASSPLHPVPSAHEFYEAHREEMEAGAVVLWPEMEDLYTLMKMRAESGHTAFEREKQSSPADPDTCEFPESYFRDHIWFDDWPSDLCFKVIALDPSKGKDARRGDFSAYILLGVTPSHTLYVEADLAVRPTPQLVADGAAHCARFSPDAFGVETHQYQELLAGEFAAEFKRRGLTHIVPALVDNAVNKLVRIRRLGPLLSQRRLRFLTRSASTKLLVDQLRDFPAAEHDDGPNALEMAVRLAGAMMYGRNVDDGLGDRLIRP
jgi:predicted phage terminase large subunit-like protein